MSYINYVKESLRLSEDDSKEIPKSELDKEKELERQNALKANLRNIMIGNIFISITTHAASQAVVRRSDLEPSDWGTILRRAMADLKNRGNGYYLYYSKSYEQGIIVYWNRSAVSILTILPKGRGNPKPGTEKIMIEHYGLELGFTNVINEENIIEIE